MDVEIKLQGFDELLSKLRDMPDNVARNAIRSAVAAGGRIIRDEAKANIGRGGGFPDMDTGTLRRSMYVKYIREASGPQRATFYVGARQGYNARRRTGSKKVQSGGKFDAYYAKWVELGHWSRKPGGGQLKRGRGRAAAIQAAAARGDIHYIEGKPFLVPAFIARKEDAIKAMGDVIAARIVRYRVQGK